jgi:hypothetical protein
MAQESADSTPSFGASITQKCADHSLVYDIGLGQR